MVNPTSRFKNPVPLLFAMVATFCVLITAHLVLANTTAVFGWISANIPGGDSDLSYLLVAFFYYGSWAQAVAYLPFYIPLASASRRAAWLCVATLSFALMAQIASTWAFMKFGSLHLHDVLEFFGSGMAAYTLQFGIGFALETALFDIARLGIRKVRGTRQ
jgi:hypothetical protein